MKIIQFLSMSKSLKETKDRLGAYKMEPANSIPNFDAAAQSTLALEGSAQGQAEPSRPLERAGSGAAAAWMTMLRNLAGSDKSRRRAVAPGQIELNLDRVTVVRNDLNDTDIDFVAPGSRAAKVESAPAASKTENGVWARWTHGVLGYKKDPFTGPPAQSSAYASKRTQELIAKT